LLPTIREFDAALTSGRAIESSSKDGVLPQMPSFDKLEAPWLGN
jgi:hypothetical protein